MCPMIGRTHLLYLHAQVDRAHCQDLEKHLSSLRQEGLLRDWGEGSLLGGDEVQLKLQAEIARADIVMLLLSADFLAAEHCQAQIDLVLAERGRRPVIVVPVLVRAVDWRWGRIGRFNALPRNGKPVTAWDRSDDAWFDVAEGLRLLIQKDIDEPPSSQQKDLDLDGVKAACAFVRCKNIQGTGYMVRPGLLVTCAHVVASVGVGGRVELRFPTNEVAGTVQSLDSSTDWALIQLDDTALDIRPLNVTTRVRHGQAWLGFGFPAIATTQGIVIEGDVRDSRATSPAGYPLIQLFCEEAAAGSNPYLHGFSGSPVLCGGEVVGHLRRVVADSEGAAQLGTLFACPVSAYLADLPMGTAVAWQVPSVDTGYDRLWYIHHDEIERTALNRLKSFGSPVILVAPEHYGKAEMLAYLLDRVCMDYNKSGHGDANDKVRIDFTKFTPTMQPTLDTLLGWIGECIVAQLGLTVPVAPARRVKVPVDPKRKLKELLQEHVLPRPSHLLLLVLDGPDRLPTLPFIADFFALLRSLVEDRSPEYQKLRVLASVSTDPALLDGPLHSGFFGLSAPLELGSLSHLQLRILADQYRYDPDDLGLSSLHELVSGHPRLLRWALGEARQREVTLTGIADQARRDPLGGVFRLPLTRLYDYCRVQGLLSVLGSVVKNPRHDLSREQYGALYRKGLLIESRPAYYELRSPLLKNYFSEICR